MQDFDLQAKMCRACRKEKPAAEFYANRKSADGLHYLCKLCSNAQANNWRRQHKERNRENVRRWTLANPKQTILMRARNHARQRGIHFHLRLSDIFIPARCPILGTPLEWGSEDKSCMPSIDRIDSSGGYVPGNIQIISWRANDLKRNATLRELILLGEWAKAQA